MGWGQTAPNPMVGAVVVRNGVDRRRGLSHALRRGARGDRGAARGRRSRGGRDGVRHARAVRACGEDAAVRRRAHRGAGRARRHRRARSESGGRGRRRAAARGGNRGHHRRARRARRASSTRRSSTAFASRRPWITLKLALSLDGALADATGRSRWITGDESRRLVHEMRAGSDAIAVGIGTVLADDPSLTVRDAPAPRVAPPAWSSTAPRACRRAPCSRSTARDVPTIVVAESPPAARVAALEALGVRVVDATSLRAALDALGGARRAFAARRGGRAPRRSPPRGRIGRPSGYLSGVGDLRRRRAWRVRVRSANRSRARATRGALLERREIGTDTMTVYAPPRATDTH